MTILSLRAIAVVLQKGDACSTKGIGHARTHAVELYAKRSLVSRTRTWCVRRQGLIPWVVPLILLALSAPAYVFVSVGREWSFAVIFLSLGALFSGGIHWGTK